MMKRLSLIIVILALAFSWAMAGTTEFRVHHLGSPFYQGTSFRVNYGIGLDSLGHVFIASYDSTGPYVTLSRSTNNGTNWTRTRLSNSTFSSRFLYTYGDSGFVGMGWVNAGMTQIAGITGDAPGILDTMNYSAAVGNCDLVTPVSYAGGTRNRLLVVHYKITGSGKPDSLYTLISSATFGQGITYSLVGNKIKLDSTLSSFPPFNAFPMYNGMIVYSLAQRTIWWADTNGISQLATNVWPAISGVSANRFWAIPAKDSNIVFVYENVDTLVVRRCQLKGMDDGIPNSLSNDYTYVLCAADSMPTAGSTSPKYFFPFPTAAWVPGTDSVLFSHLMWRGNQANADSADIVGYWSTNNGQSVGSRFTIRAATEPKWFNQFEMAPKIRQGFAWFAWGDSAASNFPTSGDTLHAMGYFYGITLPDSVLTAKADSTHCDFTDETDSIRAIWSTGAQTWPDNVEITFDTTRAGLLSGALGKTLTYEPSITDTTWFAHAWLEACSLFVSFQVVDADSGSSPRIVRALYLHKHPAPLFSLEVDSLYADGVDSVWIHAITDDEYYPDSVLIFWSKTAYPTDSTANVTASWKYGFSRLHTDSTKKVTALSTGDSLYLTAWVKDNIVGNGYSTRTHASLYWAPQTDITGPDAPSVFYITPAIPIVRDGIQDTLNLYILPGDSTDVESLRVQVGTALPSSEYDETNVYKGTVATATPKSIQAIGTLTAGETYIFRSFVSDAMGNWTDGPADTIFMPWIDAIDVVVQGGGGGGASYLSNEAYDSLMLGQYRLNGDYFNAGPKIATKWGEHQYKVGMTYENMLANGGDTSLTLWFDSGTDTLWNVNVVGPASMIARIDSIRWALGWVSSLPGEPYLNNLMYKIGDLSIARDLNTIVTAIKTAVGTYGISETPPNIMMMLGNMTGAADDNLKYWITQVRAAVPDSLIAAVDSIKYAIGYPTLTDSPPHRYANVMQILGQWLGGTDNVRDKLNDIEAAIAGENTGIGIYAESVLVWDATNHVGVYDMPVTGRNLSGSNITWVRTDVNGFAKIQQNDITLNFYITTNARYQQVTIPTVIRVHSGIDTLKVTPLNSSLVLVEGWAQAASGRPLRGATVTAYIPREFQPIRLGAVAIQTRQTVKTDLRGHWQMYLPPNSLLSEPTSYWVFEGGSYGDDMFKCMLEIPNTIYFALPECRP
jgi:hypothetical protein